MGKNTQSTPSDRPSEESCGVERPLFQDLTDNRSAGNPTTDAQKSDVLKF